MGILIVILINGSGIQFHLTFWVLTLPSTPSMDSILLYLLGLDLRTYLLTYLKITYSFSCLILLFYSYWLSYN